MLTVYVGIGHDDDLVIAKLVDVKVIAVAFGKSAAKGVDHGLDLGVREHLVHGGFLHVQDFAADRQDRLVAAVASRLGGAAGGIALHDEDFTLGGVPAFAVGQLPVRIERVLGFSQQVFLVLELVFADCGRARRALQHLLQLV